MAKAKTAPKKKAKAADRKKAAESEKLKKLEAASATPSAPDESATVNGELVVNTGLAEKWAEWETMNIAVNAITFGDRYRKDPGDLHKLARSINEHGLIQPIGVEKISKDEFRVVVGGRRLQAVKDVLGLPTIKAVVFDPIAATDDERLVKYLQMELEENNERLQPSLAEAVERARLIDRLLGKSVVNGPNKGKKKRDVVAAAVGMSHETLRQAEVVYDAAAKKDAPEEVKEIAKAMDAGEIAPTKAFKQLVESESAELDGAGLPIPKNMRKASILRVRFETLIKELQAKNRELGDLCGMDGGERLAMLTSTGVLKSRTKDGGESTFWAVGIADAINALADSMPHAQCPVCAQEHGELGRHSKKCETCHGSGHISKKVWDNLEKAEDKSIAAIQKLGKQAAKAA